MINKKINTVIDLGNSAIRLSIFDEKKKNIFSLIEEIEYLSKENNLSQSIKKIIRKSEKETSSLIDNITLLIDRANFLFLDLSIKKKIDQIQLPTEIRQSAYLDCSSIINNSYKNIKIFHIFINKITIDEVEVQKLPEVLQDTSNIIFHFKILCLPNKNFSKIRDEFKNNNIDIKNIFCSSLVRSESYINIFKDEKFTAFLDIGLNRSTLILYEGQKLTYINNIPIGSHKITTDISYMMKLNLEESEQIKKIFNKSESDFSFLNQDHLEEKITKKLINKKTSTNLLKKVIHARVDEIFKLLCKDIELSIQNLSKGELLIVLIGRGSKLFNKNTINCESGEMFKNMIFYNENNKEISKLGLEYASMHNFEMENLKKIKKKQGFFERFFNLFQEI